VIAPMNLRIYRAGAAFLVNCISYYFHFDDKDSYFV
jgi:hypothetical protein